MPRPPRLLICTDTWPPQVNGVSVVTALSVAGLQARGWECAVAAPRYPLPRFDAFAADGTHHPEGGLTTIASAPLPVYPDIRMTLPADRRIADVLRRFQPDLVHCPTEFVLGRSGQRAAMARGIPVVSSYHTDFSRYTEAYGVGWLRPAVTRYLTRFHQRSRRVYTPSTVARDDLVALGLRHVEVWGRGVDTTLFHPARRSLPLRETYAAPDGVILLHVGRLAAEKGVDRILTAYARARTVLGAAAVHLVIAGSGPREDALRSEAPDGVSFLGNLDRTTILPRLYASCDAFLFASQTETLGLVILEAMASGLPVIAAPVGGVADHLHHGENGIAYEPGDVDGLAGAIVRLVMDRALARRLAAGARRTAELLDWECELDRLDESYRDVSGPRSHHRTA
jgi:glycosyltransferase involved in cell wall biosynthesis